MNICQFYGTRQVALPTPLFYSSFQLHGVCFTHSSSRCYLLGPILIALKENRTIIIDEIDARLHTLLLEYIINLFHSNYHNPNGAQLIFTSHNTNLLKNKLRRDQMLLVEKDKFGVSRIDSLYKKLPKVRNDASFDKDYLSGKYGAIPAIVSQLNLFGE